jgi:threonine/homoserine/homoserine lactone efflux protein
MVLYRLQNAKDPFVTLSTLIAYSIALFIAAVIPGPGITALVARALGAGFADSLAMSLGLILGDMIFLTAVVLGLSVLAQTFGLLFMAIKYAGAAYLVYIAWKIWTAGMLNADLKSGPARTPFQSFLAGLLVTLGNPKAMLFYVALVPTLVDLESLTLVDYLQLLVATFLVLLAVTVPYVTLASRAREFFRHPQALKRLNRVAASFLAATAGYIALRA